MNANPLKREHDQLFVPEGFFTEPYAPQVGRILSPSLNKRLQFCKFMLSADANVTYKDYAGNQISAAALKAGYQPFLVSEISVVSAGTVTIIHDGTVWTQDPSAKDMTFNFPR